jgi:hypothetical protein
MELVQLNPNVIRITESNGVLDMLKKSSTTIQEIVKGLNIYLEKKRTAFPRLAEEFMLNHFLALFLTSAKDFFLILKYKVTSLNVI